MAILKANCGIYSILIISSCVMDLKRYLSLGHGYLILKFSEKRKYYNYFSLFSFFPITAKVAIRAISITQPRFLLVSSGRAM